MHEGRLVSSRRPRAAALGFSLLLLSAAAFAGAGCGGSTGVTSGGAPAPDGGGGTGYDEAAATQSGRAVAACSACQSKEICVANTTFAGICADPGPASSCPSGTTFNNDCCVPDPTTAFACWPIPPSCAQGLSCDCASGIVILTCGADVPDNCTLFDGGVGCTTPSA